ncbi:MAG TPA: sugar phosphate isomerase/epimerase family protein [Bryobacteraceae bacterium]|nr:sugar phosphate isomerase/epimerase family protein [Bryobacteraceae bacterium]
MNHVLSTHLFANHRLTIVWLDRILRAGIPAVEIFCARQHIDWRNRAQIAELGHWFRDSGLQLWSMHSPMYNDEFWGRSGPQAVITITESVKSKRIVMVDEIKRAVEIAEVVPFRYLVQHIGAGGEEFSERAVEAAFVSLEEIGIFARQRGVQLLLENIPNALATPERLHSFLEQTHLDVGYCFDVGHANIHQGGIEAGFEIMKDRIRSTHLHDNDGTQDSHLFPFSDKGGTVDWRRIMRLLGDRAEQFPLLLELKEDPEVLHPVEAAARIFDRLEELAAAPVEEEEEARR